MDEWMDTAAAPLLPSSNALMSPRSHVYAYVYAYVCYITFTYSYLHNHMKFLY